MAHTAIVTGGTSGLGLRTARILASRGWTVIATGRDLSRMTDADRAAGIRPVRLDLGSLAAIDPFVAAVDELDVPPVKALLCNAALQTGERRWSDDGYELTLAVNVLAPLLLIDRMIPQFQPGSRVVWTASGTHNPDEVTAMPPALEDATLADLAHPAQSERALADGFQRYATSKLCVVRLVPQVSAALAPDVTVNGFDPGLMPSTGLARDWNRAIRTLWRVLTPLLLLAPGAHRVSTSARHLADLVTSPRYASMTGAYVVDDHPAGTSIASMDPVASARLFQDALTLIGARNLATV